MINLDNYIIQGDPGQKECGYVWQTAIGLQKTDGLSTSEYLVETANKNINGEITLYQANEIIEDYYRQHPSKEDDKSRTEEADKVSARIAVVLAEKGFTLSPAEYISIHRRLFEGVYPFAGKIRDYNITKNEWVLGGKTVYYASAGSIRDTLDYDFGREKDFSYKGLTVKQTAEHMAEFISGLWQIHAFGEGNTRTTAVFAIRYLRTFGLDVDNDIFAANAWYFRNALVRANFNDIKSGIYATREYLDRFFANLILGETNTLSNRELHTIISNSPLGRGGKHSQQSCDSV
ncbi:MAG: Fic family protein [Oscillospiraceae bacterium]|nr:Fic family protein [Oscillospiraceae bacterium]